MKIVDVFDAVEKGTFEDFIKFYNGNINQTRESSGFNLLQQTLLSEEETEDKLRIIEYLLGEHIDINHVSKEAKRNALHTYYFSVYRPSIAFQNKVTKLLITAGIDLNQQDAYGAIPLKYAITINKLTTEENKEMYKTLVKAGSDVNLKDNFGKSCLDYAAEYSWRNGFITIVEECKNGDQ
ncbi:ankyrin repeat domain-containing protein [Listeria monocytogenes]|uniref:ankyrin repeat domain-containing protein n=1 Tax=Listeria monocytogenes TaxID=1639 RepID=UPI000E734139|nr:ankyrin repeat domain-containing protein [Listeria monocytogenes]EAC3326902.1 ankyrin repeat domain-containing protein [Listeria monocytogenes]EAC3329944.1 ankyrin repeat domain-containing protein [Listeria monocytogenes]EAC4743415.1 ankyrin repeat domain-containing protein [Listeria monocytogenes]EAC6069201.1 ankyrin repeat domain-containing protein [Listeria monocytogenes]EAC7119598.1 ankyrin repeat domain-containing protein [Listeria monocytogenes]